MKIHKFILLYKLLDADDDELTRTGKVRRRFVYGLYLKLIEAMYTAVEEVRVKGKIRYRDGQTGEIDTLCSCPSCCVRGGAVMDFFIQLLVGGISIGFLYGLSAMGFVMIFKSSSVLNFAHGELLAIGAYFFLAFITWLKLPIFFAFLLALIGCFLLGILIERIFLRPLIGEPLIFVIMLTVGLAAMFKGMILLIWGGNLYTYPEFLPDGDGDALGGGSYPARLCRYVGHRDAFLDHVRSVF